MLVNNSKSVFEKRFDSFLHSLHVNNRNGISNINPSMEVPHGVFHYGGNRGGHSIPAIQKQDETKHTGEAAYTTSRRHIGKATDQGLQM